MHAADPRASAAAAPPDIMRAAFRDIHGRRLHGFALLLTLGDRRGAARLAADALLAAGPHLDELRHPERAAAWLRARVTKNARGLRNAGLRNEKLLAVADLGVDEAVLTGLGALDHTERAALIAASVERLDRRDVATVVGKDGNALDRLLGRARRRYAGAHAAASPGTPPSGPIIDRVRAVAMRVIG